MLHAPRPAFVAAERSLITQMLANFVENALIHTPAGSTIEIRVEHLGDGVRLTVEDDGLGVADQERDNIFRRFYRVDPSRTTPGSGLGLSLAAAVARDDKASVARASGVGPKLAQRIVTELKGTPLAAGLSVSGAAPALSASPVVRLSGEAVAALIGLGIAEPIARRSVETAEARLGDDPSLSALIKAALQEVGR